MQNEFIIIKAEGKLPDDIIEYAKRIGVVYDNKTDTEQ
jgi:hypothetical protein